MIWAALSIALLAALAGCRSHNADAPASGSQRRLQAPHVAPPSPSPSNRMKCTMTDAQTRAVLARHETSSFLSARAKGRQELAAIADAPDKLLAIARADDCPDPIRFRAFESYFTLAGVTPDPAFGDRDAMIAVYVTALRAGAEPNLWGLPYNVQRSPTSRRLIALGAPASRALAAALDDEALLPYEGSEEATLAGRHRLRVKDLAAGLIAAIAGADFPEEPDPAVRDRTIAALRTRL